MLSYPERERLEQRLVGYDNSPDMVRISLVNMHLHEFGSPNIYEYDTLSSERRWSERYDVILANPPFFSPKGGIKPHSRFIRAKRAEVLFVDYIMKHLKPNGRAGIVVPEGIIFRGEQAYRQIRRKMLVEKYLIAVISLPNGVFNPYSGVKTSILIFDMRLAAKTDEILFVRVENDGRDLGAQRREIEENDLPEASEILQAWGQGEKTESDLALWVKKEKIAEDGNYDLSQERYKGTKAPRHEKWPLVELGDSSLFQIESGGTPKSTEKKFWDGDVHWTTLVDLPSDDFVTLITSTERTITQEGLSNSSARMLPVKSVLVSSRATIGRVGINLIPLATNQGFKNIIIKDHSRILPEYVSFMMKSLGPKMNALGSGGTYKEIIKRHFCSLQIPLPPIEVQGEIVAEIDGYQKVIDGARMVVDNYRPHININPEWRTVKLEEVAEINPKKSLIRDLPGDTEVSFVPMEDLSQREMLFRPEKSKLLGEVIKQYTYFQEDDVILAKVTPCFQNGKSGIARGLRNNLGFGSSEFYIIRPDEKKILPEWIYFHIIMPRFIKSGKACMTGTGGLQRVPRDYVAESKISLPPLAEQRKIVAEMESHRKIVDDNKVLIRVFEAEIKETINRIWEDE